MTYYSHLSMVTVKVLTHLEQIRQANNEAIHTESEEKAHIIYLPIKTMSHQKL